MTRSGSPRTGAVFRWTRRAAGRRRVAPGRRAGPATGRATIAGLLVLSLLGAVAGATTGPSGAQDAQGAQGAQDAELRFDGLYRSDRIQTYRKYLRFYADGVVMAVSSTGDGRAVSRWLKKGHAGSAQGRWSVDRDRQKVYFRTTSDAGMVKYDGAILPDGLSMNSASLINGAIARDVRYVFVPMALPSD